MVKYYTFLLTFLILSFSDSNGQKLPDYESQNSDNQSFRKFQFPKKAKSNLKIGNQRITVNNADYGEAPIWGNVSTYGGSYDNIGRSIAKDVDGNIYQFGEYAGTISMDGDTLHGIGFKNTFIAKYNSSGEALWIKDAILPILTEGSVYATTIALDNNGNIYISGLFDNSDITAGSFSKQLKGTTDSYIAKLDNDGNFKWVNTFGQEGSRQKFGKLVCTANNLYLLSHSYELSGSYGNILKYNLSGDFLSNNLIQETYVDDITIYGDYLYMTGSMYKDTQFGDTTLIKKGRSNGFLAKMNLTDNTYDWAIASNSVGFTDTYTQGWNIVLDSLENVYVVGSYYNKINWGDSTINDGNSTARFLLKCNKLGQVIGLNSLELFNIYDVEIYDSSIYIAGDGFGEYLIKYDTAGNYISASSEKYVEMSDIIVDSEGFLRTGKIIDNSVLVKNSFDYNKVWEVRTNSKVGFLKTLGIEVDNEGNTYILGYANGYNNYKNVNFAKNGIFLLKEDINGEVQWSTQIENAYLGTSLGNKLIVNNETGDILIAGIYDETINYGGKEFIPNGKEYFVANFNTQGELSWIESVGNAQIDAVAFDNNYNAIISGIFEGNVDLGDYSLTSQAVLDVFLAKLDVNGNVVWAKRSGGEENEYLGIVSLDDDDNIYLTGEYTSRNISFANDTTFTLSDTEGDVFLSKYSSDGNFQWVKVYGGSADNARFYTFPTAIKSDSLGNTYITGWHGNGVDFSDTTLYIDSNAADYSKFISKFNSKGEMEWIRSIQEGFLYGWNYCEIDIDNEGSVYVMGSNRSDISFQSDAQFSVNENDLYFAKYSTDGDLVWAKSVPGEHYNVPIPRGMAVVSKDYLKVAGYFDGSLAFGQDTVYASAYNTYVATLYGTPNVPEIPVGDESVCVGSSSDYSTVKQANILSYEWSLSPENAGIIKQNDNTASIVWSNSFDGDAFLTIKGVNEIYNSNYSDSLKVTVNPLPQSDVTQEGNNLSASESASYQWYYEGDPIQGAVNQVYEAAESGDYYVNVISEFGCIATSDTLTIIITSINEIKDQDQYTIYPNPVDNVLYINKELENKQNDLEIIIRNLQGEELIHKTSSNNGASILVMDVSTLKQGVYLVEVKSGSKGSINKVIIE